MGDLVEKLAVNRPVDTVSVVERQGRVEREPGDVVDGVDGSGAAFAVLEQLLDAHGGFEVENGHVRLCSWAVESRGGRLSAALARLVPGRGADGESLRGRDDRVEGVEHGTGNERRLVSDPEVLDGFVGIDKDDALYCVPREGGSS